MTNSSDAFKTSSPSGLPEVLHRPHRPVNMAAGTIGHFVEWYDWYIYGLLAAVFAGQIFPSHSPFASLIAALLTYAIWFVVRPFSGIIISPLADRYGRRVTLTLSISGMALGSLIIALTPGYNTIGYAAPILFVVARILQGISAGSEQQSAISFMVEHAPPHRRGLFGSFSNMASASRPSPRPVPPRSSPQPSPQRPSPPGVGASRSSWAASSAWSVSCCGHAPTRPSNSRPRLSSTRSPHRHDCGPCSANTRRLCYRQRRCPPRRWPTTPGRRSCPRMPSSPPAATRPPP